MKFSEKLQTLRKENKLSQEKLADMLDVSRQAVSKWESGQTYPEMDKLLSMCKIFNCTLDELTNDEITEIKGNVKNKNIGNNLIDEMLEIINRTCSVFRKIGMKDIIKIIFEMLIVVLILLIFTAPIEFIYDSARDIFMNFGSQIGNIFSSIFRFVLIVSYLILSIIIFVYIYKIRVLDYYDNLYTDTRSNVKQGSNNINNNNNQGENNNYNEKIIIKKEHNYTIFNTLGTIVMVFIKAFIFCMSIPFVISLLFLFASFILSIILIFKGVFYFGIILGIISCIILNLVIIELIFNFIFSRKNSLKRIFLMFIISLSGIGIAIGITMWDAANINYINAPPLVSEKEVYEVTYEMRDNTLFLASYHDNTVFYIDESLGNNIKFEIKYYEKYSEVFTVYNDENMIDVYSNSKNLSFKKTVDLLIEDLSKKQLHNYDELYDIEINVYTTSQVQEKLFDNNQKYRDQIAEEHYNSMLQHYDDQIYEYQNKIAELEEENYNLEMEKEELQLEIEEYQRKIEEYVNSINDLLNN